jgi:splicing factor 3A subunit 3
LYYDLVWRKLREDSDKGEWKAEEAEECEDAEGNVMSRRLYEDLRRQGLL